MMKLITWISIPLFFIFSLEISLRHWSYLDGAWYRKTELALLKKQKLDVLFIGTSRVAAAIDSETFEKSFYQLTKDQIKVHNNGQGFSTLHEHFLALRNLEESFPGFLKGTRVLIEAPAKLPDLSDWRDVWYFPEQPQYLITEIRWQDFKRFFSSQHSFDQKLAVFSHYLLSWSYLFTYKARIRDGALSRGKKFFEFMLLGRKKEKSNIDLTAAGGIRTDKEGVERLRKFAVEQIATSIGKLKPLNGFEFSVLKDLVEFVRLKGGIPAIFEMPISTVQMVTYQTDIKMKEKKLFEASPSALVLIENKTIIEDSDFPDYWHMSKTKSRIYSADLAKSFFELNL